jgi:hypothetical protein
MKLQQQPATDLLGYSSFTYRCWASRWKLNEYGNNFGSLRKYMQRKGTPFIWPGSKAQWNGISDVTDAKILAKHFIWAVTTPKLKI